MGRLRTHAGETLVEALASMIVIAIGLTILAGAIVASAHSNAEATIAIGSGTNNTTAVDTNQSVTVTLDSTSQTVPVDIYQDGNSNAPVYYYVTPTP